MKKNFCAWFVLVSVLTAILSAPLFAQENALVFSEPEKVWDAGNHNAFTDIIRFNGEFFLTFREGTGHVPESTTGVGDGTVRILRSHDGHTWKSAALLRRDGFDLRDAKLSITPDGRLLVTMGGSIYVNGKLTGRVPQVSFSDKNGENFSAPADAFIDESIRTEFDWLWRVTWNAGVGYGVVYQITPDENANSDWKIYLVKTTDGIHYSKCAALDVLGRPNEATVRFAPDGSMRILVRREASDRHAFMGKSAEPFTQWEWTDTGESLGGPNFLFLPDGTCFGGGRVRGKTGLGVFTDDGIFRPLVILPTSGDNSYPGFALLDDTLLVSYYSSHEGKTSIYLTRIKLDAIQNAQ